MGHSTPCGTLYHRSRKKACYPEGGEGKEEEKKDLIQHSLKLYISDRYLHMC